MTKPSSTPIDEILLAYGSAYAHMTSIGADFKHRIEHKQTVQAIQDYINSEVIKAKIDGIEQAKNEYFDVTYGRPMRKDAVSLRFDWIIDQHSRRLNALKDKK